jgi:lysyl-tRNA synthetase class I
MQTTKCTVLVAGKQCGLALTLADRAVESGTAIYECPLGHRTYVPLEKVQTTKCTVLTNGKECGLALTVVDRDLETGTATYECALGHRTYLPLPAEPADIC